MQADRDAAFGLVVKVLDALKEAGVKNIPAFTEPADKPGSLD
jgi:biopolymer transport protein ExbD